MPAVGPRLEGPFHETRTGWLVLATVWLASAAYLWANLRNGWITLDAGMLAEMADRVLHGQMPYRNFIEIYSGGVTYLNAFAFRLFGDNLFSLRIPLFLFFTGWVPSVYFIARRFVAPLAAGMCTLLAVAWSVPIYPEGMPSWYNLFFATWGVLALIRYTERRKKRWLVAAGVCGGLSFLSKISGLYFIDAALLFFVFREQSLSIAASGRLRASLLYRIFATAGLLLFLVSLIGLISQRPTVSACVYFVLPSGCLVVLLLWNTWRAPSPGSMVRFQRLFSMALPFLGGTMAPIAIFFAYYIREDALGDWARGMLGSSAHILWAAANPPSVIMVIGLVPTLLLIALAHRHNGVAGPWIRLAAVVCLAALLLAAGWWFPAYVGLRQSLPFLVPVVGLCACGWLLRWRSVGRMEERLFVILSAAILCSLIQFPFPTPVHFCYSVPLLILAIFGLLSKLGRSDRVVVASVIAFYLAFALWCAPGFYSVHPPLGEPHPLRTLNLSRAGGIRVIPSNAEVYPRLVLLIRAHTNGPFIYCTPDCPEVYFLSGFQNPTYTVMDFLDPDYLNPPLRTDRILTTLALWNVHLIVLAPAQLKSSGDVPMGLRAALDADFPHHEELGQFQVRWRAAKSIGQTGFGTAEPGSGFGAGVGSFRGVR